METLTEAQDDSSGANPSSVKSDDSSPRHGGGRGSPPPNCAICLGTCRNKSFTDSCLHQFCFKCLLTWSKVKAECPLCKQNFRSIIHNVRSNHQYEEYMVEQRHTEETTERIDIDSLTTATRRFRYRTTLTLPRRESLAIQQLLLHYPMMADVFPPPAARAPPSRRRRSPAAFRRTVYRHNLWARPLPDFTGRFRDCTPEFYRYNEIQMNRLVPWINRELHYLLNENIGHISYVMTRILELLPQYHINSPEFRDAMQRYFGDRTEHFLHELYCFASTPYDMTGYDRNVQYTTDTRISTMVNEVISSSESDSVDSDIVMVSSSEPAEPPPGPSRLPAPVYPQNYIPQPPANNVIPIETISHSDTDDDSSEVMVVGYIKPPQDRTPEVVDLLGSDSDVIVQDNAQPETSQTTELQEPRQQVPLVKLRLKRHTPRENGESDSDGSTYRPPPPSRRKRRHRSNDTATTSDTCRTTPSPGQFNSSSNAASPQVTPVSQAGSSSTTASRVSYTTCSSPATSPYTDTSSISDSSTTSSSSEPRRKRLKRKSKRKPRKEASPERHKKKSKKRSSSSHRREKKLSPKIEERDKRSKRKSHSGKGVKSSKKSNEAVATPEPPAAQAELDQPGTSGTNETSRSRSSGDRKRRRTSRENKRLRSVVNVMYTRRNSGDSTVSGNSNVVVSGSQVDERTRRDQVSEQQVSALNPSNTPWSESDSEDNIPLNLTVQKTYTSL